MPVRRVILTCAMLLLMSATTSLADEGMWPLFDLDRLDFDDLHARGLKLSPEQLYNTDGTGLADAIIDMGGGTAFFVSGDGLILTNHHVAFGAIQRQSTVEENYVEDGYYAAVKGDEIPAIGYDIYLIESIEDVSAEVLAAVDDGMSDLERNEALDMVMKEIIHRCEEDGDVECTVRKFYGGRQYVLYTRVKVRDIRVVYAPPKSIGIYGGDIDNWMWPRQTGDFAFMRAYVAPDGSPADYAEENVPFKPKSWLELSDDGVTEGDFSFIVGFPGRTNRYASSFAIENLTEEFYPAIIEALGKALKILEDAAAADPTVAVRQAARINGLNNFYKNSQGMLKGLADDRVIEAKRAWEAELTAFLEQNPELQQEYGTVLDELRDLYAAKGKTTHRDFMLGAMGRATDFFMMANMIYTWAVEREKPDIERKRGYQDRDEVRRAKMLEYMQINLTPSIDKLLMKHFLKSALELPEGQRIKPLDDLFGTEPGAKRDAWFNEYMDRMYETTVMGDQEKRLAMLHQSRSKLEMSTDPFILLAMTMRPEFDAAEEREKEFDGALERLSPKLIAASLAMGRDNFYPDANSTRRFNYGSVKGLHLNDEIDYEYYTTLTSLMEKETGEEPFIVPQELKAVFEAKDYGRYADAVHGDVPVNFLTTNDGTGGNSGSPVLNGDGQVIGLLFDGNYESIAADYVFKEHTARAIHCDIRYVLFLLERVYGLETLLEELTIK